MGTGGKVQSSLNIPVLRRLETACLALAAMTAVAQLGAMLLVIGGTVLTFWAVSGMLLVASVTLRMVSSRAARGTDVPPFAAHVRLLRSIVASAVCLICLGGAFSDLGASYRVLDPPAANGCRAVAREFSFLSVARGSYTLDWDGSDGVLNLIGGIDPVWPAAHAIPCS